MKEEMPYDEFKASIMSITDATVLEILLRLTRRSREEIEFAQKQFGICLGINPYHDETLNKINLMVDRKICDETFIKSRIGALE